MKKTAIIIGATGLTGGILLEMLLKDDNYQKVKLFSRSPVENEDPKIEQFMVDMLELEQQQERFIGDVVYCCIGTTKAKTPDEELYKKIDYGIPVAAARLAAKNGITTFVVISAMGANPKSRVFYNRTKGEMERDVLKQSILNTYILQPSLISGKRNEKRKGERMAQVFMSVFGFLVPKKYKIIEPNIIAKAMQRLANDGYEQVRITSDKIKEIADR